MRGTGKFRGARGLITFFDYIPNPMVPAGLDPDIPATDGDYWTGSTNFFYAGHLKYRHGYDD